MKKTEIMDGRTKSLFPSMKKAEIMDGRTKSLFPSMKRAEIMDGRSAWVLGIKLFHCNAKGGNHPIENSLTSVK